jgi:tetratricopeptide (TPR) repeat protein
MDVRDPLSLAIQYHQAGDLVRAEECYHKVLRGEPTHAHALSSMGALCQATGRPEEAISYLKESVQFRPETGGAEGWDAKQRSHNAQGYGGMWLENWHDIGSAVAPPN